MENLAEFNLTFYVIAYLAGSIPFGLILVKAFANIDIQKHGSGNIGATNVLRVLKENGQESLAKKLGIATLLLDALKGATVLLVAMFVYEAPEDTLFAIMVLAVVGHIFSVFLLFNGGKGVATGLGVSAVMFPIETIIAFLVWFVMGKVLKISSISSLIALSSLFGFSFLISPDVTHVPLGIVAFLIIYKHIPNIERLIRGEEKKVVS
ncbi:acyl-phosphate glycerol 3-phosphate acyltransferase [Thiovulum sp. ES]|nr:acyl-phosphate glycerol 3-phosphate acyltransferase [Thiovulum sp. ES]